MRVDKQQRTIKPAQSKPGEYAHPFPGSESNGLAFSTTPLSLAHSNYLQRGTTPLQRLTSGPFRWLAYNSRDPNSSPLCLRYFCMAGLVHSYTSPLLWLSNIPFINFSTSYAVDPQSSRMWPLLARICSTRTSTKSVSPLPPRWVVRSRPSPSKLPVSSIPARYD
jgi:hypothetical protein